MTVLPAANFGFSREKMLGWASSRDAQPILTVDSHTAGNPTRIILAGVEPPADARTVLEIQEWLRTEQDAVRTRLVHEPRGGSLTCAVLPVAATDPDHDIGAVILEPGSYPPMCGHCMIGFAGVLAELDLIAGERVDERTRRLRIATPAGIVTAVVRLGGEDGVVVDLTNVPSYFVGSWVQMIDGREIPVEVAYGGDYYPTVDASLLGLPLVRESTREIIRIAALIREEAVCRGVVDPLSGESPDIYQVMFFEWLDEGAEEARTVVVAPPGVIDRSPCGTGTSALHALLVHRGDHEAGTELRTRSIVNSRFGVRAEVVGETAGRRTITPVLRGSAYLTGFSWTVMDPADQQGNGFPPL